MAGTGGDLGVAGIEKSNPQVNGYDWWRQIEMGQLNQRWEGGWNCGLIVYFGHVTLHKKDMSMYSRHLNWKRVRFRWYWDSGYSHWLTGCALKASETECQAFHLVYVCQCRVHGPLNALSAGLLIEPDQFTETASRLAQLPHQRDSNNCTLWPLPSLEKAIFMLASKQSTEALNKLRMQAFTITFQGSSLCTRPFRSNLGTE